MSDLEKLIEYKKYLNGIQAYIDKCFENQSEYIFCKKGCSHCCNNGSYPYSKLEFEYLILGFVNLDRDKQLKIQNNIKEVVKDYKSHNYNKIFHYKCPFLAEDNSCIVYDYRGIICRNFGILQITAENEVLMPFCESLGLNYSNIYDDEKNKFDYALVNKLGLKNKPKPYPMSRNLLMNKDLFENEPLDFGETKSLVEWLRDFVL